MQQVARTSLASVSRDSSGTPILSTGGYGYGLRVRQSCVFRHIVAHGGGLPGFGSVMQWYPEHGVALIAMGNLTYAGWGGTADLVAAALHRTGALRPREPQPSAALVDARAKVNRLIGGWDDALADALAADNLFKDESKARRRAALDALRRDVGACRADPDGFLVENALRGQWTLTCERGRLQAAITLAPTMPPAVQFLSIGTAITPTPDTCR
jgi:hypothetical protein